MNMNKNNNNMTQGTVDERILAELKAENKDFGCGHYEILAELRAENLLLSLQNENEQLRMENAKMN